MRSIQPDITTMDQPWHRRRRACATSRLMEPLACPVLASLVMLLSLGSASAQEPSAAPEGWAGDNTTTITRSAPEGSADQSAPAKVRFVALLTADGQKIDKGLVWRIFQSADAGGKTKLLREHREASPTVELVPGDYVVSAAFGRANLTKKLKVKSTAAPVLEQFVLNAGGLRISALVTGHPAPPNTVSYDILSDRDQSDTRKLVMSGAKPGLVIRLNAGIYHIVSTYGDANATVASDVTVEAGKLTEAQISHSAAKATFKLVERAGGEALSDTQWTVQTRDGRVVKQSMGALPSHTLAPGTYTVLARSGGQTFNNEFSLRDGETAVVEVVMNAAAAP